MLCLPVLYLTYSTNAVEFKCVRSILLIYVHVKCICYVRYMYTVYVVRFIRRYGISLVYFLVFIN